MGLLDEYIKTDELYKSKYGPATVLFLQCGDFFELYAVLNDVEEVGADIYRVGDICNLQVTRKNKSIIQNSRSNPLMAGFPLYALAKHAESLLAQNYTVVVMRQTSPPPNVTRAVTEIMSPGVSAMPINNDSQYLMVFFFSDDLNGVGIAGVDVSTGKTFFQESCGGAAAATDDIARAIQAWNPRELAVYARRPMTGTTRRQGELARFFTAGRVHLRWGDYDAKLERPAIQNGVLRRAYRRKDDEAASDGGASDGSASVGGASSVASSVRALGSMSYVEQLNLERMDLARMAFVLLLEFTFEHSDTLIQSLKMPIRIERDGMLSLEYTSAVQLNLTGGGGGGGAGGETGLLGLLNRCSTAFGRRLFRERLMNPVNRPAMMTARYDAISSVLSRGLAVPLAKMLGQMLDLERMARRIRLGTFPPCDWLGFYISLDAAKEAALLLGDDAAGGAGAVILGAIATIGERFGDLLILEECGRYLTSDIRSNIFRAGAYPDLDAHQAELSSLFEWFTQRCRLLSGAKLDCNERDGYYISITKRRWEALSAAEREAAFGVEDLRGVSVRPISASSTVMRVATPAVHAASDKIMRCQKRIAADAERHYRAFLTTFTEEVGDALDGLVAAVADLDVTVACSRNAADYGYARPEPIAAGGAGGLTATGLRHPIIERIQTEVDYVANDVAIGTGADAARGWLLYGINASGKSSLMKAIGLNVIMAQAGMFVAASAFRFVPYDRLFTRIQMNDNIYRGMSSFTVEMTELRTILAEADANSLVLGDELCAGTESVSAVAIVAAGIRRLLETGATFVFATHLHELGAIDVVQDAVATGAVFVGHLHTAAHPSVEGGLIYDRHIQPGPGSPLYGLEVCRGLGMDDAFLSVADRVRRQLTGVAASLSDGLRVSPYNRAVVVDTCGVCGAPATETHHIRYQRTADAAGWVDNGVAVHRASNLVPLCEACHQAEHHGDLTIHGYRATVGGGVVLEFTRGAAVEAPSSTPAPAPVAAVSPVMSWLLYTDNGWMIQGKKNWLPRTEAQVRARLKKTMGSGSAATAEIDRILNDLRERWLESESAAPA